MKYLPEVDGLRAVAVLSVVAYHAGLGGSGYVGVDVFFVISGYLITRLLVQDGDLLSFYARRARRILPAAILVTVATLGLSVLLLPDPGEVALSASAAAIFGANFWFQRLDYWASDTQPLLHLWSLSVEEQFYLLWPFVLLFAYRTKVGAFDEVVGNVGDQPAVIRQRPQIGKDDLKVVNAREPVSRSLLDFVGGHNVLWMVFWSSLVLYAGLSYWHPSAAFYQMPARAWGLAAGGLVALLGAARSIELMPAMPQPVDEGAGRIGGARDASGGPTAQPMTAATTNHWLLPQVRLLRGEGIGVVTQASHISHPEPRARLNGPAILRNLRTFVLQHGSHIGLAVIGLALLPWPVCVAQPLAVLGATLVIASVHAGHRSVLSARPLVWVGLISYSLYLWHWPLLAIDRALRVGESPLAVRLALCGVAGVLAVLTYRYVETPFRRSRVRPARAIALGVTCAAALSCTAFVMADAPAKVDPLSCNGRVLPAGCVQVDGPVVALWGDSFVTPWQEYTLAQAKGLPAVRLGRPGCMPTLAPMKIRGMQANDYRCGKDAREAFNWLRTHEVDTLVVTARWVRLDDAGREGVLQWARELRNVRRIVVVGAQPELRDAIDKCLRLGVSCDVPRRDYERASAGTKQMTRKLDALPNVEVLELGDWMCDADMCRGVRDGMVMFRADAQHVSDDAVRAFTSSY